MRKKHIAAAVIFISMLFLSATFIAPILYMFVNSLKTRVAYYTNTLNLPGPGEWRFENYTAMFSQFGLLNLFKNTAFIAVTSCTIVITLSVLASYSVAKISFRLRRVLYLIIISTIFIPGQASIVPMYVMFARVGLLNTYWSVILAYTAGSLPGNMLLMVPFFQGIPNEMIEAGKIDGCEFLGIVRNIIVPIGMPAIAINIIFNMMSYWNDLFTPMILIARYEMRTVIVALAMLMGRLYGDPPFQLSGLFLAMLPMLILYAAMQKFIIKGITVGAINK
jgi:ABC-type glycerol-3-phosphate transport system permease component